MEIPPYLCKMRGRMRLTTLQLAALIVLAGSSIAASRSDVPREAALEVRAVVEAPATARAAPFRPAPVMIGDAAGYSPPDFTTFRDVKAKKRAFYDYLLPMVHEANEEVARERAWLESLARAMLDGHRPTEAELREIELIEARYSVTTPAPAPRGRLAELLRRVDVVPASLVIAQAAKESGWGTSRFAREGNNFFGIWCFYEGCGMLPLQRDTGRNHEVATFDSVAEGVRYYIRTINTHAAYEELREMRRVARAQNEKPVGTTLANGLIRYSERGLAYVREIQSMIRYNGLSRFNRPYSV